MQFKGQLLLPGDDGPGLSVCLDLAAHHLAVESDSGGLGAWPLEAVDVERLRGDVFALTVAGESLRFVADDTVAFTYSGVPAIRMRSGPYRPRWSVRAFIKGLLNPPASGAPAPEDEGTAAFPAEVSAPITNADALAALSAEEPEWPELELEEAWAPEPEPNYIAPREAEEPHMPADELSEMRCPAVRSDGRRCESTILTSSGYCHPHDPRRAFEDKYRAAQKARAMIKQEATGKLNRIYSRLEKAMRQVERGELDPEVAMAMAQLARTMCAILDVDGSPSAEESL